MKKLLAILMTITMCFSLVVVASAETYSGTGFNIDFTVDGTWDEDPNEKWFSFETSYSQVKISAFLVEEVIDGSYTRAEDAYNDLQKAAINDFNTYSGEYYYQTLTINGYDAFLFGEISDGEVFGRYYMICTNKYLFQIDVYTLENSDEFNYITQSVENMTFFSDIVDDNSDYNAEAPVEDNGVENGGYVENEGIENNEYAENESVENNEYVEDEEKAKDDNKDTDSNGTIIIIVAVVTGVAIFGIVAAIVISKKKK